MKTKQTIHLKNYYNPNEIIDIYIGQNSGENIENAFANAKSEILVLSPYIDEKKLDEIIHLKNKNINVRLIFSEINEKQYKEVIKKLVHQNRETDLEKKAENEKLRNKFLILSVIILSISVALCTSSIINLIHKSYLMVKIGMFLVSMLGFYLGYLFWKKKKDIDEIEIYSYEYTPKLNFKYLRNDVGENNFMNSSIYIIDREISYLGSINFTTKSFNSNYETVIKIANQQQVNDLVDFIYTIFDDNWKFRGYDFDYLGKQVYTEEKN